MFGMPGQKGARKSAAALPLRRAISIAITTVVMASNGRASISRPRSDGTPLNVEP